jgi:DNA polymerase-3 subunit gamma/tau
MEVSESIKQRYLTQCQQTSMSFLLTALNICNQCDIDYKSSKTPRLHVEIALMKKAHLPSVLQLASEQVKKKTSKSNGVTPQPDPAEAKVQSKSSKSKGSGLAPRKTRKLPSIESLKASVTETSPIETIEEPIGSRRANPVDKSGLLQFWQEFAEQKRQEGKQQEFLVLNQQPELVDDLVVQIKLNSSVQIETVDRLKSDLMPFLRDKLHNDGLRLEAELQLDQSKPLIYTPAEKFKYLAEKHPTLKALQEKLGLDPDF